MAKLKNLVVHYISLVDKPATGESLTLKRGDLCAHLIDLKKADDEKQIAYGVVYAPDEQDAHGDSADSATIERAAHEFMRHKRTDQVDVDHNFDSVDAYVAESWIAKTDDEFAKKGAWAVGIKVNDNQLWKKLKAGELTGISMAGTASRSDDPQGLKKNGFWDVFNFNKEEKKMDKAEVEKLVAQSVDAAVTKAVAGLEDKITQVLSKATTKPKPADEQKNELTPESIAALVDEKITKAIAKGVDESGDASNKPEVSFL